MKSQGTLVSAALAVIMSAAICFSEPETITKLSAAFSFPTTVGIAGNRSSLCAPASFLYNTQMNGKKLVSLSWSLPGAAKTGTISIFTVSGSKIKTFSITSPEGRVEWNVTEGKKVGKGVYFAAISYGTSKKNLKLVIN
jgi:hypothetical protein